MALSGSCLCGKIKFTIENNLIYAAYCHCSDCRKASGSSYSVFGGIEPDQLKIREGQAYIGKFVKSAETIGHFCKECGSGLFAEKPKLGLINVLYGVLDDAPPLLPQAHLFVGSMACWDKISDELPTFEKGLE